MLGGRRDEHPVDRQPLDLHPEDRLGVLLRLVGSAGPASRRPPCRGRRPSPAPSPRQCPAPRPPRAPRPASWPRSRASPARHAWRRAPSPGTPSGPQGSTRPSLWELVRARAGTRPDPRPVSWVTSTSPSSQGALPGHHAVAPLAGAGVALARSSGAPPPPATPPCTVGPARAGGRPITTVCRKSSSPRANSPRWAANRLQTVVIGQPPQSAARIDRVPTQRPSAHTTAAAANAPATTSRSKSPANSARSASTT